MGGARQPTALESVHRAAGPPAGPLIVATKLHAPTGRGALVPRPGLLARLAAAPAGRLVLVSAPAGWGKTTLIAEWAAAETESRQFAWVSLDPADNDPVRFFAYVVEALRRAAPELDEAAVDSLSTPGTTLVEVALPALVNEIEALSTPIVLVLDDYHAIRSSEIHEGVSFLVERLPPTLSLVLVTRFDPRLPLPRLRARGELTEIRAEELRFSAAEAATFLNEVLGLGLDESQVGRLHERTEGWAAGLYLAALSLRGRDDVEGFIGAFAGDNRHVVDYLAQEVLENQPEHVREFLVRTSVLERLCGPLCDAVTGGSGSARMLADIERSNLFLVPLDTRRRWYRYHRLFATLLRQELGQRDPELVPTLHRRALDWCRRQGEIPEAIQHAFAAGEISEASELIASHWNAYFNQGRLATVAGWLDALPAETLGADSRLSVARAWTLMDLGRLDEAGRWTETASEGVPEERPSEGGAATLRVVHRFKVGDVGGANEAARRALALDWGEDLFGRTVATCLLGITLLLGGRAEEAATALGEALTLAEESENQLGTIYALGYLALLEAERGESEEAERRAAAATSLSDDPGRAEHFVTMVAYLGRGKALAARGEVVGADAALGRAVELSRRGAGRLEAAYALLARADVRLVLDDREEARALVRRAREILELCPDPGVLRESASALERRLSLAAPPESPGTAREELTDRELAVLRLLATELSRREIGAALYVSVNTVKTHTRGIFRKLDVSTRAEAVRRARELELL